jgi:hypothetical protein
MNPRTAPGLLLLAAALLAGAVPGSAQTTPGPDPFAFEWQFEAPDTRSRAMGGAYVALAEGATAAWWNPATLAGTNRLFQMPFSRFEPVPENTFGSALYHVAASGGRSALGFGVSVARFSRQGLSAPTIEEPPTEETIALVGGGIDLVEAFLGGSETFRWTIGASYKRFHVEWGNRVDGDKQDGDIGTALDWRSDGYDSGAPGSWRMRAGANQRNAYFTDVEFTGTDQGALVDFRDRESGFLGGPRFGLAYDRRIGGAAPLATLDWTWTADLELFRELTVGDGNAPLRKAGYWKWNQAIRRSGMEFCWAEWVSVRAGVAEDTFRDRTDWSYGFGIGPSARGSRRFGGEIAWAASPKRTGTEDDERLKQFQLTAWMGI